MQKEDTKYFESLSVETRNLICTGVRTAKKSNRENKKRKQDTETKYAKRIYPIG